MVNGKCPEKDEHLKENFFLDVLARSGEFHRLDRCFIDWATAEAGEADIEPTSTTRTMAQSIEISGISAKVKVYSRTLKLEEME